MKKLVLSITAVCAAVSLNAQNIWSENFDQLLTGGTSDFTVANNDADTLVFGFYNFTSSTATWLNPLAVSAGSASWTPANGALSPDNLLISPEIDLSTASGTITASWDASTVETTADGYYAEHYAMYAFASTADVANILTATPLFEETLAAGDAVFSESVDISSFAGGNVVLVIRHYNCTDMNLFVVDNFSVDQVLSIAENTITAEVYPNPANDVLNVTTSGKADRVSILSLDGKVVSSQEMNGTSATVNVAGLNSGAYIYEVTAADGSAVRNTFMKK